MRLTLRAPYAFVLMPFSPPFADIYERGIKRACDQAGVDCQRVDEQYFTGNIVQRVLDEIGRADIIIAEMTGRNANVFYEAGYARALQKPIIFLSQDNDLPFDVGHDVHVRYTDYRDLRQKLIPRVSSAIKSAADAVVAPVQADLILVNKQSGKCLDVELSTSKPTNKVQQWSFHGHENQLWRIVPSAGGYFRIMSVGSHRCLSVAGNSTEIGAPIIQWEYHATPAQQWQFRTLRDGTHIITNRGSAASLAILDARKGDGSVAVLADSRAAENERWWLLTSVTAELPSD
jgi:hypothetical protein